MCATDFQLSKLLLPWFHKHGRKTLPWQVDSDAYCVWVSEIMLQQTQVNTVIPYYHQFLKSFPNIKTLASANQDEVLAHWSGLGYYARARNLHKAAMYVCDSMNGELPLDIDDLQALPGIGRSTAGAILSLACGQKHAILDGNVKRVLARCYEVEGWPGTSTVLKKLWLLSEQVTPEKDTAYFNQAMMDLGATLCSRNKPDCEYCPLQSICAAYKHGRQQEFPTKKPKQSLPTKSTTMLIIHDKDQRIRLYKRPPAGLWGGLWTLPEIESSELLASWCRENGYSPLSNPSPMCKFRHTFSHFHLQIDAIQLQVEPSCDSLLEENDSVWYKDGLDIGGMPSPITKLISRFWEQNK